MRSAHNEVIEPRGHDPHVLLLTYWQITQQWKWMSDLQQACRKPSKAVFVQNLWDSETTHARLQLGIDDKAKFWGNISGKFKVSWGWTFRAGNRFLSPDRLLIRSTKCTGSNQFSFLDSEACFQSGAIDTISIVICWNRATTQTCG